MPGIYSRPVICAPAAGQHKIHKYVHKQPHHDSIRTARDFRSFFVDISPQVRYNPADVGFYGGAVRSL